MNYTNKKTLTALLWSLLLLLPFGMGSCNKDNTEDGALQLYYKEVTNIGPSMSFTSDAPSYYGPQPYNFSISAITLDGVAVECPSFAINAETGVISISNTEEMTPGLYKLTVSCIAQQVPYHFYDIFVVRMLPALPFELKADQELLEIPYAEAKTSEATITLTPEGESVSILSYALQQPEGQEYFSISKEGVISVNKSFKGEILPGTYPLTVLLKTYAGSNVYEGLAVIKITSPALELTYTPNSGRMEYNMGYTSVTPTMKGSQEEVVYSLKAVTPETDQIKIDPTTGVLSVEKEAGLPVDGHYVCDVTVTNRYGAVDFVEAFSLTVIPYIEAIEPATFAYATVEVIQGTGFVAEKQAGFVGDEVLFSLGELPEALVGQVTIDEATGTVSAANGNSIPLGEYAIPVLVKNTKNEASTTLTLKVIENPYYFSRITYGNNLGLTPSTEYANQFWCKTEDEFKALNLTPETDAKPGTVLEWSLEVKVHEYEVYADDAAPAENWKYHGGVGSTIDPVSGVITQDGFFSDDPTKSNAKMALLYVTATAGKGQVGETTVSVPVFFLFANPTKAQSSKYAGIMLEYKPFVFCVNPTTGGRSVAPIVSGVDDQDPSKFNVDFRRDFQFWSFTEQGDGWPANVGSFMNHMWGVYNAQEGITKAAGTGAKPPMSYFSNTEGSLNPQYALAYVDQEKKEVVVNPGKWFDANGEPANGVLVGEMTIVTDGGKINNGAVQTPIMIWFDEKF